jgi:hypothetical protein
MATDSLPPSVIMAAGDGRGRNHPVPETGTARRRPLTRLAGIAWIIPGLVAAGALAYVGMNAAPTALGLMSSPSLSVAGVTFSECGITPGQRRASILETAVRRYGREYRKAGDAKAEPLGARNAVRATLERSERSGPAQTEAIGSESPASV